MEFNEFGNIRSSGIIPITINEFKRFFVDNLDNKEKRREIFESFTELFNTNLIKSVSGNVTRIWVDGSFCTNKELPGDIDFVLLFRADEENYTSSYGIINELDKMDFQKNAKRYFCDAYCILDNETIGNLENYDPRFAEVMDVLEKNFDYWSTFFLSDRDDRPKPIFEIKFEGGEFI